MRQGSTQLELDAQAVHLYIVDLNQCTLPTSKEIHAHLPEHEFLSTQNFVTDELKNKAVLTKMLTRKILARYLNIEAKSVPIIRKELEKPTLAAPHQHLHFNIAHTQNYLVMALTKDAFIGIDVESLDKKTDVLGIAKRFFHPDEYQAILNSDNKKDTFFRIWTQKEAFVKAIGEGLSFGLEKFCVDPEQAKIISIDSNDYHPQDFHSQLLTEPNHYVCVTAQKNLEHLHIFSSP